MDNQKSNDGSGRNVGNEGAGSSMGKDLGSNRAGGSGTGGAMGTPSTVAGTASDLHKGIDKAADAAQPMVDRLASSAHEGVDKVSGALTDASARMSEKSKQLTDAYQHFADSGRGYVRSSPATSILVAAAAGFVLAKLLGSRR